MSPSQLLTIVLREFATIASMPIIEFPVKELTEQLGAVL